MLGTMLRIELKKLRGTLAPLLTFLAPLLVTTVALLIAARQGSEGWMPLVVNCLGLWTYFVLPMTIAALAALLAQIEHGPRAWDHLFALPISRSRVVSAKLITLLILIGVATSLLMGLCFALGAAAGASSVLVLDARSFPWGQALGMAAAAFTASTLMAVIQLWVALAHRSFVVPVALGLAGTFVVVASMGAPQSIVVPWAMPLATLPVSSGHPLIALLAGGLGGIALLPFMAWHLARRQF